MRAYGKIILFGEHVVVYGYPALAAALSTGVECKVIESNCQEFVLQFTQLGFSIYPQDSHSIAGAFRTILDSIPQPHSKCKIEVCSEIPFQAGLGSSAALAVSLIKTLLKHHRQNWNLQKINDLAYQAETVFHGTPSGIDNTVANFGGLCFVADTRLCKIPNFVIEKIALYKLTAGLLPKFSEPISLVVVDTQKDRETKKLVQRVRQLYESDRNYYTELFSEIGTFAYKGYELLQSKKYKEFGALLNHNHQNLQKMDVSCRELDQAWELALSAGALGAKLTGAGGGGCLIAFAPKNELLVMEELKNKGLKCFIAQIG